MGRSEPKESLKKVLNLRDLVLLNISCIVGLSSLAQAAQLGFATVLLYLVAIIAFLIPAGLMVAELNSRIPEEGGFYVWTKKAFGNIHGYIAAWSYWLSNIVWLPAILLLITSSGLYIFGDQFLHLNVDFSYYGSFSIAVLWLIIILNIMGMERARWIQNIGGASTWAVIVLLLVLGVYYVADFGSARPVEISSFLPDLTDFTVLPFFAAIAFGFGGLELAPVMSGEIKEPTKNVPRAIFISSVIVGLLYIVGTLLLVMILPQGDISVIEGMAQAFHQLSIDLNTPWLGSVGALLVVLGTFGLLGAWMAGAARLPFVVGLDHFLPKAFGKVHPRWGSPYISLLIQGVVLTLLFLASTTGSSIHEAFLVLYDMSIILYFIPFLYMFGALVVHARRNSGGKGVIRAFQNKIGWVALVALVGFGITLFSIVIATIPTQNIQNKELFVLKVLGGAILLNGLGLIVYFIRKNQLSRNAANRR